MLAHATTWCSVPLKVVMHAHPSRLENFPAFPAQQAVLSPGIVLLARESAAVRAIMHGAPWLQTTQRQASPTGGQDFYSSQMWRIEQSKVGSDGGALAKCR